MEVAENDPQHLEVINCIRFESAINVELNSVSKMAMNHLTDFIILTSTTD